MSKNITLVSSAVTLEERARHFGHHGGVLWMTGYSGSGKSTLALSVERRLFQKGFLTYVLDGDNLRSGLNSDLAFSQEARTENIRRAGHVAALFAEAGFVCICAFISPYEADRLAARKAASRSRFFECHIDASIELCEKRDPKGLYRKARSGELKSFTGIDAPYETPHNPDLRVQTGQFSIPECVEQISRFAWEQLRIDN